MRRMITEKEADKLRFIKTDSPNGMISLGNDDAEIAFDDNGIALWTPSVRYYNPDDDYNYFDATPDEVTIKTDFAINNTDDEHIFYVYGSNSIYMDLPTQDPHNKGCLWNDNGTLKISLG